MRGTEDLVWARPTNTSRLCRWKRRPGSSHTCRFDQSTAWCSCHGTDSSVGDMWCMYLFIYSFKSLRLDSFHLPGGHLSMAALLKSTNSLALPHPRSEDTQSHSSLRWYYASFLQVCCGGIHMYSKIMVIIFIAYNTNWTDLLVLIRVSDPMHDAWEVFHQGICMGIVLWVHLLEFFFLLLLFLPVYIVLCESTVRPPSPKWGENVFLFTRFFLAFFFSFAVSI